MAQEFESFLNNLLLESTMNSEIQNTLNDFEKIVRSNVNPGDEITPEQFATLDLKGKTQYVYKALLENIAEAKSTGRLKEGEDLNALGILGQILLETGNFKSSLNTKYFNFGGHKADKWWKANGGEFVSIPPAYGGSKEPVDWRIYSSLKEGLKGKIDYFIDNSRYRKNGVMQAKTPAQHLLAAQKAGYAGTEENYAKLSMERVNKLPELLQDYDENIGKDWTTINPASDMEAIESQRELMAQQNLARKNNQPIPEFQPTVLNSNIEMNSGPAYPKMQVEMPMEIPQDNRGQIMYGSFYNDPKSKQDAALEKQVEKLLAQPIKINKYGGRLNNNIMKTNSFATGGPFDSLIDPPVTDMYSDFNSFSGRRRRGRTFEDRLKASQVNMFGLMNPYSYGYPIRLGSSNYTSDTYINPMAGMEFRMPLGRKTDLNTRGRDQYGWNISGKIGTPYNFNRGKNILKNSVFGISGGMNLPYSITDDQAQNILDHGLNEERTSELIDIYNTDIDQLAAAQGIEDIYQPQSGNLHNLVQERDALQRTLNAAEEVEKRKYAPYLGGELGWTTPPFKQDTGIRLAGKGNFYFEKDPISGYAAGTTFGPVIDAGGRSKDYTGEYRPGTGHIFVHPFLDIGAKYNPNVSASPAWAYGVDTKFEYKPGGIFKNIPGYLKGGLSWSADPISGSGGAGRPTQYNKGDFSSIEELVNYYENSPSILGGEDRSNLSIATNMPGQSEGAGNLGYFKNIRANLGWTIPLGNTIDNIQYARANAYARRQKQKEEKEKEISPLKRFNPLYNPGIRTTGRISETGSAYSEEEEYKQ